MAVESKRAHGTVTTERLRPEYFGQPALAQPSLQVHLKKPVLSVNEAQGHVKVMGVLSTKRRHAHVITHHRNRRRELGEGQGACRLWQRTLQQQPKCAARKESEQH